MTYLLFNNYMCRGIQMEGVWCVLKSQPILKVMVILFIFRKKRKKMTSTKHVTFVASPPHLKMAWPPYADNYIGSPD